MSRHERFRFRTAEELAAGALSLGVDLPLASSIDILLHPVDAGSRRLPNRLAIHPMEGADAGPDGGPEELTFRRYERFGAGGAGLIWFEAAAVVPEGRSNPRQLLLGPETVDGFARLVERTRAAARAGGAGSEPLLILQLTHSGRFAKPEGKPVPVPVRRSPALDPLIDSGSGPPLLEDDAIDALRTAFVQAAALAGRAGFDGVDIKACHGYLVSELLAARDRPGRYGGPYENRVHFLRETIREIRTAEPGLLAAVRLNAWDGLPRGEGFGADPRMPDHPDSVEPLRLARDLAEDGISLLNVTAGIPRFRPQIGRPFDRPVRGGEIPGEHPLEGIDRLLRLAASIQRAVPGIPVVGTGYSWLRTYFPPVAAGVIEAGGAAVAGLGRLAFAYPGFARDLAGRGRLDPRRVCIACSGCSTLTRLGRPAGCVVRDASVYRL